MSAHRDPPENDSSRTVPDFDPSKPPQPPPDDKQNPQRDVYREELESRGIRFQVRSGAWIWVVMGFALGMAYVAYRLVPQKGTPVVGRGHVVTLPETGTWVFLSDGTMVEAKSAGEEGPELFTGACTALRGWLDNKILWVEQAECEPGGLLRPVMERVRELRLKPAYWDDSLAQETVSPEDWLGTLELYASMADRRFDNPQVLPLYRELFPGKLAELRAQGLTGKPMVFHVQRDDFVGRRLRRDELELLFAPEGVAEQQGLGLAGAAVMGGWLVRDLELNEDAPAPLERLLFSPLEDPWPELLAQPKLKVRPMKRGD